MNVNRLPQATILLVTLFGAAPEHCHGTESAVAAVTARSDSDRWNRFRPPSWPISESSSATETHHQRALGPAIFQATARKTNQPDLPTDTELLPAPTPTAEPVPTTADDRSSDVVGGRGRPGDFLLDDDSLIPNESLQPDPAGRPTLGPPLVTQPSMEQPFDAPPAGLHDPAATMVAPSLAGPPAVSSDGVPMACPTETCACAPAPIGPGPICPWFGGADLLFWTLADTGDQVLVVNDAYDTLADTTDLDPSTTLGFDVHLGRYLCCGRYALDVGFLYWNPDQEQFVIPGAGGLRASLPTLRDVSINRTGAATTVFDDFDNNAARIRPTRDIRVLGLEANLTCFGILGARRLGECGPCLLGLRNGYFGGLAGPLARAAGGCYRVQTLHGFRWFQFEDEFQLAGNVDGVAGYAADDLYYDVQTENNLFGYQFGARWAYCLGCRTLVTVGGKMGIYANDVQYRQRLGTQSILAYTNWEGAGAGNVLTEDSDVTLAGLGELDLGLGYRLSNRWMVRGGYRMLAATGVATSVGQLTTEFTSAASSGNVRADDALILHGAYVGLHFNW
ncbi:BBP7 family outer membrane beta-barrel protein [Roseiconus nitratireducens]|uniref:BBP7 family outer membrane beta-barrel protein n=1 Tax=Roseiconus nitratireducens TaxID=2605748 RepID=A0A5M6DIG3_9BACT|nr:BBP7 family outer membrane beta-barrel protein [Roseiconus nitratireducens]KAA5545969.1 BBP7 family outer membrane beta-barrel protein [Roseiconus nitratireducens]